MKNFLKNITPKMVIIWAISFVLLLTIGFGTTAGILASIKKTYGVAINADYVLRIEFQNESGRTEISIGASEIQDNVRENIVNMLNNGRRTNKLMDIFRGSPSSYSVQPNTTSIRYNSGFSSEYSGNALIIWFATPQFHISGSTRNNTLGLGNGRGTVTSQEIHTIMIPLNKTSNKTQEQTWYFANVAFGSVTSPNFIMIPNTLTYQANYSGLWNYINELHLF